MKFTLHHREITASTNLDARSGSPGDVFTADFQTAGRGRLDHTWESAPGRNLLMSVVLPVHDLDPAEVATLPLIIGLAITSIIRKFANSPIRKFENSKISLKWPNDIFLNGEKVAGILCERNGDNVIAGIGVNIDQPGRPSLGGDRDQTRDAILASLSDYFERWLSSGFAALYPELVAIDYLKGRHVSVRQTDDDSSPITGLCGGIQLDGSLLIGNTRVYAGEAHVEEII